MISTMSARIKQIPIPLLMPGRRRPKPRFWLLILQALLAAALMIPIPSIKVYSSIAKGGGASELIAEVNALRAARGLAPYQVNSALMAAAQGQSDYQAETGAWSHTGRGGSMPKDRAVAAGYGSGTAFVAENIATGNNLSPQAAVQVWQGDSLHLSTMLNPNARDVGAGVASNGDTVYWTLVVGYTSASNGGKSNNASQVQAASPAPGNTPVPAQAAPTSGSVIPMLTATPHEDGTLIHVVEPGQVLINIAQAYAMNLADLLALNGLDQNAVIYPGEKLIIKKADRTATPVLTPTVTSTPPPPTRTRRPTRTPTIESPTGPAAAQATMLAPSEQAMELANTSSSKLDPLLVVIAFLVVVGTGLVVVGSLLKRGT